MTDDKRSPAPTEPRSGSACEGLPDRKRSGAGWGRRRGQAGGTSETPIAYETAHPVERPPSPPSPRWGEGRDSGKVEYARSFLLHEDAHILVFNKPSGLAVQGGSGVQQSLEHLLAAFAKSNGKRPRLVHRLDRETSGVIVAARTKPAAALLSQAFSGREANKTYLAIVCGGAPDPCDGEIALPLRKSSRQGIDIMEIAQGGDAGAQAALTRYRTLAAVSEAALLVLGPRTGRMHQIRAHLAAIGRPIAGDGKYGGMFGLAGVAIPRLMLHAAALEIPHPGGGTSRFEAPLVADFAQTLKLLALEAAAVG